MQPKINGTISIEPALNQPAPRRRTELATFLRARRERLVPLEVPVKQRRRTPGLRREEVAELAGISADWYRRLEEGRDVHPSPATLSALAHVLQLNEVEKRHLTRLANPLVDKPHAPPENVPDAIRRIVDQLGLPAFITGRRWDVLFSNAAAEDLFGFGAMPVADRNVLLYMFKDPRSRRLFGDTWHAETQRIVAQCRFDFDLWCGEAAFVELVNGIRESCPEFASFWDTHEVRDVDLGTKNLQHPIKGNLNAAYASFISTFDPALKLVVHTIELNADE